MSSPASLVPEGDTAQQRDRVELSVPARPELMFLVRMTAAAVASRADFGYDQIEDLRLAIDELSLALCGEDPTEGRLQLLFKWTEDAIEVVGVYEPEEARAPTPTGEPASELSERILDALVDEHGADIVGGCPRAWLRMKRRKGGM